MSIHNKPNGHRICIEKQSIQSNTTLVSHFIDFARLVDWQNCPISSPCSWNTEEFLLEPRRPWPRETEESQIVLLSNWMNTTKPTDSGDLLLGALQMQVAASGGSKALKAWCVLYRVVYSVQLPILYNIERRPTACFPISNQAKWREMPLVLTHNRYRPVFLNRKCSRLGRTCTYILEQPRNGHDAAMAAMPRSTR